jgi:hypothetical protein
MKVDIFTACHEATPNEDGTFTVVKAFCSLSVPSPLPKTLQNIKVAMQIEFDYEEAGDCVLTLRLLDADLTCLQSNQKSLSIPCDADARNRLFRCVVVLDPFVVKTYGEYRMYLEVNRKEKAFCSLYLSELPNKPLSF